MCLYPIDVRISYGYSEICRVGWLNRNAKANIGQFVSQLHTRIVPIAGLCEVAILPDLVTNGGVDPASDFRPHTLLTYGEVNPLARVNPENGDSRRLDIRLQNAAGKNLVVDATAIGATLYAYRSLTQPGIVRNLPLLMTGQKVGERTA